MGLSLRRFGFTLILIASTLAVASARADDETPPFNIERLLAGSDRKDFSWKVWVEKPYLTMQQRYLVVVGAVINCDSLKSRSYRRNMHFVIKVGSVSGRWVPEHSYTPVSVPPDPGRHATIRYAGGMYLKPGNYTIAVIAYDDLLKKHNVWRKTLKVSPPKNDPLPGLDLNLPDVEFIYGGPGLSYTPGYYRYTPLWPLANEWPSAEDRQWLPVKNNRPICIDIVANVSAAADVRGNQKPEEFGAHLAHSSYILQIASVLSHLGLRKGQVRLTLLDVLQAKTLVDRIDATQFDWHHSEQALPEYDPETVDFDALGSPMQASAYLRNTIYKIMKYGCAPGEDSPLKMILFVSGPLKFPRATVLQPLNANDILQDPPSTRLIYMSVFSIPADDLSKMLKPSGPQIVALQDSISFRRALAAIISQLEGFRQ